VVRLPGLTPYREAWDLQRQLHADRVAGAIDDTVVLLEHEPVYTAGRRTDPLDRPTGDPGAEVIDVDRGGKITWHGPGQLVAYPILRLPDPVDVVAHVRRMEQLVIDACAALGVAGDRVPGRSGVWVLEPSPARKVAAVGVRVARGVTMHGLALNCDADLTWFDRIVPCGIRDAGVTSLTRERGIPTSVAQVASLMEHRLTLLTPPHGDDLPAERLATTVAG